MRKLWATVALFGLTLSMPAYADVSDDVVKIAVLDDMSGVYSDANGQGGVLAARMAIEEFGGTVLGKPIKLIHGDHQNKPDIGMSIARRWFDVENVDMIAGLGNSAVALAVQQLSRDRNKINLISGSGATDLTGRACSPNGVHWTYDNYSLAKGTGSAVVKNGGDKWFFLTADYTFGHSLEENTSAVVKEAGGKILGSTRHPLNTADFSSFLLTAQASGANVLGLANAGNDMVNAIKQAAEFGLDRSGIRFAGLLVTTTDVHGLGLAAAQGLMFTTPFFRGMNDEARIWSDRFLASHGAAPTALQAGVYSATLHYLKAVKAAGTDEPQAVLAKMRELRVNDFMTKEGYIRKDGRLMRDMYLVRVKSPAKSTAPWDYLELVSTIPSAEAFKAPGADCPLNAQN